MSNKFEFDYCGKNSLSRKEIEDIRKKYLPHDKAFDKIQELKKLNQKVQNIPTIVAFTFGILGTLIFGLGLAMCLEWNLYIWGSVVGVIGFVPTALAYPIYQKCYNSLRAKYGKRILSLSDEILKNQEK